MKLENYLELGWGVILLDGKRPCDPGWPTSPALTLSEIQNRLVENPKLNLGIRTGSVSGGLVVLDVDPKNGGNESWDKLNVLYPFTGPYVKTGSGGRHFYFTSKIPIRNSVGKLGLGIDIRGEGGQVVAPPSIHPETKQPYNWRVSPLDVGMREFPEVFINILSQTAKKLNNQVSFEDDVIEGGRNQFLTSLAGSMRRKGMGVESIRLALNQENIERCDPPLDENEVRTIAESVGRYEPEAPARQDISILTPLPTQDIPLIKWSEITNIKIPQIITIPTGIPCIDQYTDGGLGIGEVSMVIAQQESGKTTFGCFVGANAAAKNYPVLHVFYEDDLRNIWQRYSARNISKNAPLFLLEGNKTEVIAGIPLIERKLQESGAKLVLIDYLARIVEMGDDRHSVKHALMSLGSLAKRYSCHIMIFDHVLIHHTPGVAFSYRMENWEVSEAKMYKSMIVSVMLGFKRDRMQKQYIYITGMKMKRKANELFSKIQVDWATANFQEG